MPIKPTAYAMYRLPESSRYVFLAQTDGQPETLPSVAALNGRSGFVVAPFVPSESHRVYLLRPDLVEEHAVGPTEPLACMPPVPAATAEEQAAYARCFQQFHEQVRSGRFGKLVLSRSAVGHYPPGCTPEKLFLKACRIYPHQMIALVSLPGVGTWLMATPEVLLEGDGHYWQTMALAGTMPRQVADADTQQNHGDLQAADWSEKNRAEQRYVSSYIHSLLQRHADHVEQHGPYTTMAAHLLHLRTDFRFSLRHADRLGSLLADLYPTPAVCGLPKDEARQWILAHEAIDRRYYSGFCGPLDPNGSTHLYVSLRCMELRPDAPVLYAGGGILPGSTMQQEWRETEAKLQTMRRLLATD